LRATVAEVAGIAEQPGTGRGIDLPHVLAVQESDLADEVSLLEVFTVEGVIPCLRHSGPGDGAAGVALFVGGALGGLSGPAAGLYGRVAQRTGGIRLHYRHPGDLAACVADVVLVAELVMGRGAAGAVLVGHSFGGAVAVAAGVALGARCTGVVTLATQAPGCERVDELAAPILLVHGDEDEILPDLASRLVHGLAGGPSELVILPGEGHLLAGAANLLDERVGAFVLAALDRAPGGAAEGPPGG
jgi:pimeloyl-ACP methyl ester carboxylesterase